MMMIRSLVVSLMYVVMMALSINKITCIWMPKEAAEWTVNEFDKLESIRNNISFRGTDRRASAPFISGNKYTNITMLELIITIIQVILLDLLLSISVRMLIDVECHQRLLKMVNVCL